MSQREKSDDPNFDATEAAHIATDPEENLINLYEFSPAASQMLFSTEEPGVISEEQVPPALKDAATRKNAPASRPTVLTSYGRRRSDAHKLQQQLNHSRSSGDKRAQHAKKTRGRVECISPGGTFRPCNVTFRVPQRSVSSAAEDCPLPQPVKAPRRPLATLQPSAKPEKTAKKVIMSPSARISATSVVKDAAKKKSSTQSDKFVSQKKAQVPEPKIVAFSTEEETGTSKGERSVEKEKKAGSVNLAQPFKVASEKFKEYVHVRPKDPSKLRKGLPPPISPGEPRGGKENVVPQKLIQNAPRRPRKQLNAAEWITPASMPKSAEKRKLNETMTLDDIINFGETKKSTK